MKTSPVPTFKAFGIKFVDPDGGGPPWPLGTFGWVVWLCLVANAMIGFVSAVSWAVS